MNQFVFYCISNAIQVAILASIVFLLTRVIKNAAVSRCLWILVLLKAVTPSPIEIPLIGVPSEWQQRTASEAASAPHHRNALSHGLRDLPPKLRDSEASVENTTSWLVDRTTVFSPSNQAGHFTSSIKAGIGIVGIVWGIGSVIWFGLLIGRSRRFARLISRTQSAPERIRLLADKVAIEFGILHPADVRIVSAKTSPFLWGYGARSVIVLPQQLTDELSEQQLRMVLAHELSHMARQTRCLRWLEVVVAGLYWWHPAVWLARNELRQSEELCCDATVIDRLSICEMEYARTLLKSVCFLADNSAPLPMMASGFGERHSLKRRITMITTSRLNQRLSFRLRIAAVLAAAIILPMSPFAFSDDDVDGKSEAADIAENRLDTLVRAFVVDSLVLKTADKQRKVEQEVVDTANFQSSGETIVDGQFETKTQPRLGVPHNFAYWSGDKAAIVGRQQGIAPRTGKQMLRMLGSGPNGCTVGYTSCEMFQIVDVTKYRDLIDDGWLTLSASAFVNRVHRNDQTDSAFSLKVFVCDGTPDDTNRKLLADQTLGEVGSSLYSDNNPDTWETLRLSMRVPKGTTYFAVCITAGEDKHDDGSDEFHGHYVDDISVSLHKRRRGYLPRPTSRTLSDISVKAARATK